MKKVGIIGAGISGLAVAVRLARLGFEVHVYEQAAKAGGKLNEYRNAGFRFDMGPSLFTLPQLLDEVLDPDKRIAYDKLDLVTRYFYEDGTCINAYSDADKFASEVESKTKDAGSAVLKYLKKASVIYSITAPIFIFGAFHRLRTLLTWPNLWRALQLPRIQALQSLHQKNSRSFKDARVVQLFDRFATYNGSNPFVAPATLQVISHLEHNIGAFFPRGGMYRIVEALQEQAESLGVQLHFGSVVQQVSAADRSLLVDGRSLNFDLLVSDVDVEYFYGQLLKGNPLREKFRKDEASSSALIFYWGMDKEFPQLDVHNIFFSQNYEAEFQALFEDKTMLDDPTVYVYVSSKKCKGDAPDGHENWFVMVNAPADVGQNWAQVREEVRGQIIRKLERLLGESVGEHVVAEELLDPAGIELRTSSVGGAIYGASSNSRFSAFRRHPNYRRQLPGIYFVGGSVHPGGGIPLCLSSAKIVAEMIQEKEGWA